LFKKNNSENDSPAFLHSAEQVLHGPPCQTNPCWTRKLGKVCDNFNPFRHFKANQKLILLTELNFLKLLQHVKEATSRKPKFWIFVL